MPRNDPLRLPATFAAQADGTDIDIREDRWGGITLVVARGVNVKCLEFTHAQAAAIARGLALVLTATGDSQWPSSAPSK
jgi:hypothetical protein